MTKKAKTLVGRTIVSVTRMGVDLVQNLGWPDYAAVVYFDDGSKMFPTADAELNGPGVLFGENPPGIGGQFYILGRPEDSRAFQGLRVKEVRPMTPMEIEEEGWGDYGAREVVTVLIFHDGTKIYASRDSEGNGPGDLMVAMKNRLYGVMSDGKLRPR